jgi:hypothetical protein
MTTTDLTIRPFEVHVPDEDLADLRRRLAAMRWPGKELVADRSVDPLFTPYRPVRTRQDLPCTSGGEPRTPSLSRQGVPAACPIGWSAAGTHGHSRTAGSAGSPADRQADPLRKPTF